MVLCLIESFLDIFLDFRTLVIFDGGGDAFIQQTINADNYDSPLVTQVFAWSGESRQGPQQLCHSMWRYHR
jgi:hypothetical protein